MFAQDPEFCAVLSSLDRRHGPMRLFGMHRMAIGLALVASLLLSCGRYGLDLRSEDGGSRADQQIPVDADSPSDTSYPPDASEEAPDASEDASDSSDADQDLDDSLPDSDSDGEGSCLTGPGPIVHWVFATSSVTDGVIIEVPDSSTRAPHIPLKATDVALTDDRAVFVDSKLEPVDLANKDELVEALSTADEFTVTLSAATNDPSQYGYLFTLWSHFSLVQNHNGFMVSFKTGPTSSTSFGPHDTFATTNEYFLAAGWDGQEEVLFTYTHDDELRDYADIGTFAPSAWTVSSLDLLLGNSGADSSPWQGTLRGVAIYDRVLTHDELLCLDVRAD